VGVWRGEISNIVFLTGAASTGCCPVAAKELARLCKKLMVAGGAVDCPC